MPTQTFGPQSALSLSLQRPARLVPGVDSADHVTDVAEAQFLRGPHRQRRALTIGAVEDQLPPRRGCHLTQQATRLDEAVELRVGRVDRAGDDAVAHPLAVLAQVDEHAIRDRTSPRLT